MRSSQSVKSIRWWYTSATPPLLDTSSRLRTLFFEIMSPSPNKEPIPQGFETLPVYAEGEVIPGASPKGVLGARGIRAFRHISTAVRFVLFSAPGPLVSTTIIVGTEPISDAGHPHTLEHIIFLGSQKYPDRGYLDNLACRCISDGTNAWTDDEYTAYTATTAGLDGFLSLLPCYLDHILRPKINRAAFDSEVYHIRPDGKEAGVVFCEMQARENTEGDLSETALHRIMYKNTPLAYGCGGICKDIRSLTNQDIADFHRNQYCGANVSVVIGGSDISADTILASVKPLLDEISTTPGFQPGTSSWQVPLHLQPLPPVTREVVPFPSNDETMGSIVIAWRGPGTTDKVMRTAIDVMLRYLSTDVWSPLRQAFVEVEDQLASDIDCSQETYLDIGSFALYFEGVDHLGDDDDEEDDDEEEEEEDEDPMEEIDLEEEEKRNSFLLSGKVEKKLMDMLQEICSSGELPGGLDAVHVAIKKEKESLVSSFESGSHSAVPYHLTEELVYGGRGGLVIGEESRGFLYHFEAVKQKDEAFWISVIKKYFVDASRVELIMVPDAILAEKLAKEEQNAVDERVKRIGKEVLMKLGRENEERIASLKTVQFKTESFPEIPSTINISRFPYEVSRHSNPHYIAQSVTLETDFIHCTIMLDSKRLSFTQRILLPLLCEIISTCDILLEDGCYVQYTDNARAVSEVTISNYESAFSVGLTYGIAPQCIVVHFIASPESFKEASELMLRTLFQSEITGERVAAVSQSVLASCTAKMREGDSVLSASDSLIPYQGAPIEITENIPNYVLTNFISSFPLITFLSEEFSSKKGKKRVRQKVISKMHEALNEIRSLPASDIMVQISARDPQSAYEIFESAWKNKATHWKSFMKNGINPAISNVVDNMDISKERELPISRRIDGQLSDLLNGQLVGRIIGIGGVESSFMDSRVDCNVFVGHSDWGALNVLLEMLSRVEGRLSDAVRVSGLAYGVQLHLSTWRAKIALSIMESSSLLAAWEAICNCLEDFRRQLDSKDRDTNDLLNVELDTAKASTLFSLNHSRSSPSQISIGALARSAIDAPASPAADQALEAEIEKVSLDCLKRVFDAHVKPLYTSSTNRLVVATCGQTVVSETIEQFAKSKWPIVLESCSPESLCPKPVRNFVKSLKK